jgi:hypothetical protein
MLIDVAGEQTCEIAQRALATTAANHPADAERWEAFALLAQLRIERREAIACELLDAAEDRR